MMIGTQYWLPYRAVQLGEAALLKKPFTSYQFALKNSIFLLWNFKCTKSDGYDTEAVIGIADVFFFLLISADYILHPTCYNNTSKYVIW